MGPKRDLVGELFDRRPRAAPYEPGALLLARRVLQPGVRPADEIVHRRGNPDVGYKPVDDYIGDYELKQLHEIVDRYDPDLLWADGQWFRPPGEPPWRSEEPIAHYYNQAKNRRQPKGVVVNDRFDTHFDFATYEQRTDPNDGPAEVGVLRHMGYSWGYNKHEPDEDYKTSEFLIQLLADVVSKNGNLLLNIGPRPDGTIPDIMRERLRASAPGWTSTARRSTGRRRGCGRRRRAARSASGTPSPPARSTSSRWAPPMGPVGARRHPDRRHLADPAARPPRALRWTRRDEKIHITVPSALPSDIANTFAVDWDR